jgi:hypothetical protein
LPYAWAPVYRFPDPAPFTGSQFYNPYAGLTGTWRRANLHAHGTEWGGLTNGQQPSEDVARTYRALGYDIAGISNYQSIAAHDGVNTLPLYEHGYNISKRHQLAIGAHRVEWFDFPLWQALSHEQFIIDRVRGTTDLVGLTHPVSRDAYTEGNLHYLTGYQLIEVVNGPFAAQEPWDAALSSGHLVWAMANDDTHDTGDPKRTGMAWNMIDAPSTSAADIVSALAAGRSYAVGRKDEAPPNLDARVTDVAFENGTLLVSTEGAPSDIEFIGQQGQRRHKAHRVLGASYKVQPSDTYVRTVIHTPRTTLFLNPVVRYDGARLPSPVATVDGVMTWTARGVEAMALVVATMALWPRRRAATSRTSPAPIGDTDRETA